MALDKALVTIDDLQIYLKETDQDVIDNEALYETVIQGASSQIETFCGRRFILDSSSAFTEYFDGVKYPDEIFPKIFPIVSVTSLHDDLSVPASYGTVSLLTENTHFVVYDTSIRKVGSTLTFGAGYKNIKLVYTAGYNIDAKERNKGLPGDLRLACLKLASYHLNQRGKEDLQSETTDAMAQQTTNYRGDLPPSIKEMIAPYRVRR